MCVVVWLCGCVAWGIGVGTAFRCLPILRMSASLSRASLPGTASSRAPRACVSRVKRIFVGCCESGWRVSKPGMTLVSGCREVIMYCAPQKSKDVLLGGENRQTT